MHIGLRSFLLASASLLLLLTAAQQTFAADSSDGSAGPAAWADSAHADAKSESFTHWDKEGEIPTNCAACHSQIGFLDFIGADDTEAGVVDHPSITGTVVGCETCHNPKAESLSSVTFPSGIVLDDLQSSAQCMVCHQGRASLVSVENVTANKDEDSVSADLQFINVHYRASAATLYGGAVRGGYEYPGKTYQGKFNHVPPFNSCVGCHDAHSLEVAEESCVGCHQNQSLEDIRTSVVDVDNDGDVKEGIANEIDELHLALLENIGRYSQVVVGSPVLYDAESYPYFFSDTDKNGELSKKEAIYPNRYQMWTPRLLKAAYNYQFVEKDAGAYAHNPTYVLQLLHDSIESLAEKLGEKSTYSRPE